MLGAHALLRPLNRISRTNSLENPLNSGRASDFSSSASARTIRTRFVEAALYRADRIVEGMRRFLYTKRAIITIDILVILSVVQLIFVASLDGPDGSKNDSAWVAIGTALLVIFFVEMILKMICFGVRGYFFSMYNRIDFFA